jgi:hypothetical protein
MNSEELLAEISGKLDRILGFLAISGVDDAGERISRLRSLGLDNPTIAAMTGMTTNAVAVRVHRMVRAANRANKRSPNSRDQGGS